MASGFALVPVLLLLLSIAAGALGMLDPTRNSGEVTTKKVCDVCRCADDQVDCSSRKLTTNLHDYEWPKTLMKFVNFENNDIVEIHPFNNVTPISIDKLSFSHNKIAKIDSKAFRELKNLTELDLSNNLLTSDLMPDAFDGKFAPEAYEPLDHLRVLDLSGNKLERLHHDLFEHVVDLKRLILSNNPFHSFNGSDKVAVSGIAYLEELDLSHCQIKELDETTLHSFKKLKKIDLSYNEFEKLPQALQDAGSLETLILDGNRIEFLGRGNVFPSLLNLKFLSIDNMATLLAIDKGAFSNLENLETISIENCTQLEEISEVAFVKQFQAGAATWPPLRTLNLSNNALHYLPATLVARWDKLEELHLMNNQWSCDCENQYLIGMLLPENGKRLMGGESTTLRCTAPPEHSNKTLSSLSGRKLRCLDLYGARPERDAAVLVGLLIGVLLAMPVVVVFFLFWRRGFFFCGPQGPASFSRAFYRRAPPFNDDV